MTTKEVINIEFTPNMPQKHLLTNMKRFNIFECHRRAGKSYMGIMLLITNCLNTKYKNAKYAFVAPEAKQGERNATDELLDIAYKIPGTKFNKNERKVTFVNGAAIYLLGVKNADSLRGTFWDGIILDEFRDMDNAEYAWNSVILPSLTKWEDPTRQGWVIITTTPPQSKHFYSDLFKMAQLNDSWYVHQFPVTETGLFSKDYIETLKKSMTPTSFAIEYMCSHTVPVEGAYFAESLIQAEASDRIDNYPYDPAYGVYVSFDLGSSNTVIWFAQKKDNKFYLIDYCQNLGSTKHISYYLNILKSKPYRYNRIFLPHDSIKKYQVSEYSVYQLVKQEYKALTQILKKEDIPYSIQRANLNFYRCYFDRVAVGEGVQALREFGPKLDKNGQVLEKVDSSSWASHGADSFRYMIQGLCDYGAGFENTGHDFDRVQPKFSSGYGADPFDEL